MSASTPPIGDTKDLLRVPFDRDLTHYFGTTADPETTDVAVHTGMKFRWPSCCSLLEFEPALHGEGDFGVRGSDRKPCEDIDRQLAHGVCGYRPDEFHRGGACVVCAQAAAAADARRDFGKGAPG